MGAGSSAFLVDLDGTLLGAGSSAFLVDLDGTLLGRDERISPAVAKAVRRLSKKMPVCIATGREPSDVIGFARKLPITTDR